MRHRSSHHAGLILTLCLAFPSIAPAEQESPNPETLVARVECVAWARASINHLWRDLGINWHYQHEVLWRAGESVDAWEERHVAPWIDSETQMVMISTYFPDGVAIHDNARNRQCLEMFATRAIDRGLSHLATDDDEAVDQPSPYWQSSK